MCIAVQPHVLSKLSQLSTVLHSLCSYCLIPNPFSCPPL